MPLNLVTDAWLPVRQDSGRCIRICPADLSDPSILRFDSGRPDFDGALYQFAIALLQTAFAPEDNDKWLMFYENPPAVDVLNDAFQPWSTHFTLGGDGPRFMQDFDLEDTELKSVSGLLIDGPGDNTLTKNADHFVKRDTISRICPSCSSIALFTLQLNAPSGGSGHRTSLRGGGPLTTLVIPKNSYSLWQTLWLNVFDIETFRRYEQRAQPIDTPASMMPWLTHTVTSEDNRQVLPMQVHPLQMYWGMPRRIRLDLDTLSSGNCELCGKTSNQLISSYRTRNHGTNYAQFRHPLTPHHYDKKQNLYLAQRGQRHGVGYRDWLGLVFEDEKENLYPAQIIHHHYQQRRHLPIQLWVFGYDMDQFKARNWCDAHMPCYDTEDIQQNLFLYAKRMVQASEYIDYELRSTVRKACFGSVRITNGKAKWSQNQLKNTKLDASFFENLQAAFWHKTEDPFYRHLEKLLAPGGADVTSVMADWRKLLYLEAKKLFQIACDGMSEDVERRKCIELAAQELINFCYGKKLRDTLRLPETKKTES